MEARLKERAKQEEEEGKKLGGRPPEVPDPEQAKAQRNFTDPELRMMKGWGDEGIRARL